MPNIQIIIATIGSQLSVTMPEAQAKLMIADYKAFVADPSGECKKGGVYIDTTLLEVVLYFPLIAYLKGTPHR